MSISSLRAVIMMIGTRERRGARARRRSRRCRAGEGPAAQGRARARPARRRRCRRGCGEALTLEALHQGLGDRVLVLDQQDPHSAHSQHIPAAYQGPYRCLDEPSPHADRHPPSLGRMRASDPTRCDDEPPRQGPGRDGARRADRGRDRRRRVRAQPLPVRRGRLHRLGGAASPRADDIPARVLTTTPEAGPARPPPGTTAGGRGRPRRAGPPRPRPAAALLPPTTTDPAPPAGGSGSDGGGGSGRGRGRGSDD